jgi:CCR4-NOT transcription complex subunit 7/8
MNSYTAAFAHQTQGEQVTQQQQQQQQQQTDASSSSNSDQNDFNVSKKSTTNISALQAQNAAAIQDAKSSHQIVTVNGWSSNPSDVTIEQPATRSALLSPASQARASKAVTQPMSPVKLNSSTNDESQHQQQSNNLTNSTPQTQATNSKQQANNTSLTTPAGKSSHNNNNTSMLPTTSPVMQPIRSTHARNTSQNSSTSSAPSFVTLQQQHQHNGEISESSRNRSLIVNVWADNLVKEIRAIESIVDQYSYIAMDTEFPGVVAKPLATYKTNSEYQYQVLKCNVDILKMIQLGLCFCDENGRLVPGTCTWQFNFAFSLEHDMYAENSIDLLKSSGIDFALHQQRGIDPHQFAELLMTSGIVLNEDITWISFASSYDFGYLLRLLTATNLPPLEQDFLNALYLYFPCFYDIKYLLNKCDDLNGGLQAIGNQLNIPRIGQQHQAGSDSLLTQAVFWEIKRQYYNDNIPPQHYMNYLHQFSSNCAKPTIAPKHHQHQNSSTTLSNGSSNSPRQLSQYPQQSSTTEDASNRSQHNNNTRVSNSTRPSGNAATNAALDARYTTPDARGTKKKTSQIGHMTSATPPVLSDFMS